VGEQVARGWAGIDVGKGHHWVCLIDETGSTLWSSKVVNEQAAILDAIGEVLGRAQQVTWAVDITSRQQRSAAGPVDRSRRGWQPATYVPGRTVNQMSTAYAGEAKTDARDAYVIAETVRHRGDLTPVDVPAALVTELRLVVTHRTDLVADRVRMINRLRDVLSGYFPALEREFDYSTSRGAVVLLTGCQSPGRDPSTRPFSPNEPAHGPQGSATRSTSQRPLWGPPTRTTPPSPAKTSPHASSRRSSRPCWNSTSASTPWTRGSLRPSTPTHRLRSSSHACGCPASAPS